MSKNTTNKTYVKAELLPGQKEELKQKAENMKYSLSEYIRLKMMDETAGKEEVIRMVSRHIPRLYYLIEQIEDECVAQKLKEELSQLCQCLK